MWPKWSHYPLIAHTHLISLAPYCLSPLIDRLATRCRPLPTSIIIISISIFCFSVPISQGLIITFCYKSVYVRFTYVYSYLVLIIFHVSFCMVILLRESRMRISSSHRSLGRLSEPWWLRHIRDLLFNTQFCWFSLHCRGFSILGKRGRYLVASDWRILSDHSTVFPSFIQFWWSFQSLDASNALSLDIILKAISFQSHSAKHELLSGRLIWRKMDLNSPNDSHFAALTFQLHVKAAWTWQVKQLTDRDYSVHLPLCAYSLRFVADNKL